MAICRSNEGTDDLHTIPVGACCCVGSRVRRGLWCWVRSPLSISDAVWLGVTLGLDMA